MTNYIFLFGLCTGTLLHMALAGTIAPSASATRNLFAQDLFQKVASARTQENVVFSPASIQSCLLLAYLGAEGTTEQEMRTALKLGVANKEMTAHNFGEFLKSAFKKTTDGPQLRMANRIYVNDSLKISPTYGALVKQNLDADAQPVKFADAAATVQKINQWVEQQTENKIQNLLQPDAVNQDTSAILVNAIYFKALWQHPFSKSSTYKADFNLNANQKVSVEMMYNDERFRYAELPNLDAKALELPYKNSDLSMLVLLPNKIDGLQNLEKQLATLDLNQITQKMQVEDVDVSLPKFKIEFDIDLKQPVQQLGMTSMFSNSANFHSLFDESSPQKISEIKHKAYLDVNEAGSEAAAATFMKIVPMSMNLEQKTFRADHPFYFAIRSPSAVYFAGHVSKF